MVTEEAGSRLKAVFCTSSTGPDGCGGVDSRVVVGVPALLVGLCATALGVPVEAGEWAGEVLWHGAVGVVAAAGEGVGGGSAGCDG